MTVRIFLNVNRGPMDATPVCVYPWERRLLEHIHGQEVELVSIDDMAKVQEGVVRTEKVKFKYDGLPGPDLRQQLEAMAYVDPEDDPAIDPSSEYSRLEEKYGMDGGVKMPVVAVIYGLFESGGFERVLKEFCDERIPKPMHLRASGEGLIKPPNKMNVGELRVALTERGIEWDTADGRKVLLEKLEGALVE